MYKSSHVLKTRISVCPICLYYTEEEALQFNIFDMPGIDHFIQDVAIQRYIAPCAI